MERAQSQIDFNTAVIICAGVGTRDLPHSLIRPNTLGEIGDSNTLHQVATGLANVGIRRLVMIVRDYEIAPGFNYAETLLNNWFEGNPKIQADLIRQGKKQKLIDAAGPHDYDMESIQFAVQDESVYGTGAALSAASRLLRNRKVKGFVVANGDGFMHRTDGGSDAGDMIDEIKRTGAGGGLLTTWTVPDFSKDKFGYGAIVRDDNGSFTHIDEGPEWDRVKIVDGKVETNVGLYAFADKMILNALDAYMQLPSPNPGEEYYLTDAVNIVVGQRFAARVTDPNFSYKHVPNIIDELTLPENVISIEAARRRRVIGHQAVGQFVDCADNEMRTAAATLLKVS